MRNLLAIFLFFGSLSFPLWSVASSEEDSLLEEIIQDAGKSYVNGVARDLVIKTAQDTLSKRLDTRAPQYVSRALTIYSLARNAKSYGEAKNEQDRYFRGMGLIADTLSVIPATSVAGSYLRFKLLGDAVVSGYINKEAGKKILNLYMQAARIDENTMQIKLATARGEFRYLQSLWGQAVMALDMSAILANEWGFNCKERPSFENFETAYICLLQAERIVQLNGMAARLIEKMFSTHFEIINVTDLHKLMKLDPTQILAAVAGLQQAQQEGLTRLQQLDTNLRHLDDEHAAKTLQTRHAGQIVVVKCLDEIRSSTTPFLKQLKLFDLHDPADREFIKMQAKEVQTSFKTACDPALQQETLPPRTRQVIETAKLRLSIPELQ